MKRSALPALLALTGALSLAPLHAQPFGQWDFENGNLTATVGTALSYIDGPGGATQSGTQFGTTTSFGIPNIGGAEAKIMRFPATTFGMGYYMPNPNVANGGGGFVNDWTIVFDVLFPADSSGKLRALMETDGRTLVNNADFFVGSNNGIGINGQFDGQLRPNTWHRVGFVVEASAGLIRKYIDGIEVGVQSARDGGTPAVDGRWALLPGGLSELFSDDNGETALGYVNSIQVRGEALSRKQMLALAGPSAAGIPQTVPPIPSGIERWIPRGAFAGRDTAIGAVIDPGGTTIQDSSIVLKLNGQTLTGRTVTRANGIITVSNPSTGPLAVGSKNTIELTFTDSIAGVRTFTREFTAALFYEDFEGLPLGPRKDETNAATEAFTEGWTHTPPSGWSIDNSQFPATIINDENPDADGDGYADLDGRTEWAGWSFANKDFWVAADNQTRDQFTRASGTVAIADPDEWDDQDHAVSLFNSVLKTPEISLVGIGANTAFLQFDSSWRPEGFDDTAPRFPATENPDGTRTAINNQTALVFVSYDGGAPIQVLKYDSQNGSPTFKPDAQNEQVLLSLNNPAGAQKMVLTFQLRDAANDWWWAIDNVVVNAGSAPPVITGSPQSQIASAGSIARLSVQATGERLEYRWQFNGADIPGATGATHTIPNVAKANEGEYRVIVSNLGGSATSDPVRLTVLENQNITDNLVVHLKFDNNLSDSSGRNNAGTAVGSPTFKTGKVGSHAVHIPSGADYVSLGAPADLNFGTSTDFTIALWAKAVAWGGDPSLVGNKDWNSGGNQGYVIFTAGGANLRWNLAGAPGSRKDFAGPGSPFRDQAWHHVAVVFQRNVAAYAFIDGQQIGIGSLALNANNLDTPDGFATNIGQDGTGNYGSVFTDLDVDDLGIWRRVLSSQELAAIHEAGQAGTDLSQVRLVVKSKPAAPRITISDVPALAASFTVTSSAFDGISSTDTLATQVLQISAEATHTASNGLANPILTITSNSSALAHQVPASRLFPGRTYHASLRHQDQNGVASDYSAPVAFTVGSLPAPLFIEDFESTADGGIPAGWTRSNQTDVRTAGLNLNDPNSDSYLDWTVVPFSVLQALGNDRPDANVVTGKSVYAESDNRGGNQIQYLLSPEYNLSGVTGVWTAFKSNYKQNQDSIAVLEYTVNGGTTWLPVIYMVNDRSNNSDIVRNADGSINALTTLTTTAGDIAKIIDPATGQRVAAGKYADFILARPLESLGPFISGRIDDDGTESKRHERFRLSGADGQARVQFRFVQAGTGSWWWGVDDFALYGVGGGAGPQIGIARQAGSVVLTWAGAATLEQADSITGPWTTVTGAASGQSIAVTGTAKYFRLRQ